MVVVPLPDIELLELRAGSHEEKCQTIDKTIEEFICQKQRDKGGK